ncbi:DUF4336 domain-containing protein [Microcoleus sp. FACHB-1515]|uniref:DUF4336 domain-containing protein n=1 Tax=Cyanophyceae TaxID=3028117 RepID=UPI001682529F|nr:DUF4336 domain-containing protein [Microcoleus sp. FACHB-1515]MBD2093075.1 DUF4336 domain-containing protein [Microcoleus sp. FACHB-1515]
MTGQQTVNRRQNEWAWRFWPLVPLYPYGQRQTLCREIVPDSIWVFEQIQGFLYIVVPIRMTIVKLAAGGLLVYAPIAPTAECLRLVRELVALHGDVRYIILPTASGLEHKVFVGPFARQFQAAQVFVAPTQWSFPVNLPLSWLGFPAKRTQVLPLDSAIAPFADEFDYAILGPIKLGLGQFEEVAFFHKRSRTLLVTDTVLSIPADPPAVVQLDPFPLLFYAKEDESEQTIDTSSNRRKGWERICLFAFYFAPSALEVVPFGQSIRNAAQAADRSRRAYFGWFPFRWKPNWLDTFNQLRNQGRLLVAPILRTLILNRAPTETLAWVDRVCQWNFQRVIPAHFDAPIAADPQQFRSAFAFLRYASELPIADVELLQSIDAGLSKLGILPPAKVD